MRVRLKIKEIAVEKKMSQRQLALRSGVDVNRVRWLFHHPFTIVTTETLGKLATVLEVDVSALIESVPDEQ